MSEKISFGKIISKLELFFNGITSGFKKIDKDKAISDNTRFDIGIDDIQKEHSKVPKKMAYITVAFALFVMSTMTMLTIKEQVKEVENTRKQVAPIEVDKDSVKIELDEQSWKYHQGRKIEMIAEDTQKKLDNTKQQINDNTQAIAEDIKKELTETVTTVRELIGGVDESMQTLKSELKTQLEDKTDELYVKINENKEAIAKAKTTINSGEKSFDADSRLLPPPLKDLNIKKVPKIQKEAVKVSPESNEYTYEDVAIDNINIVENNTSTSLYEDMLEGKKTKTKKTFHVMKGVAEAILLTGINAPTFGGTNSKERTPVLFSVNGDTFIANDESQTIENCLVGGSASGNVNSSTAEILLTDLSCSGYDINGKKIKIEQEIKGWVFGENGGLGVQGRLLDSSGKVITKMIALEIIESLSKSMIASSTPQNTTVFGAAQNAIPYDDAAVKGLGTGVNKGLDKAYEHYSQILSGMYPVISVMAGKKVTLMFKGGEDLTPTLYDNVNVYEKFDGDLK